MLKVVKRQKDKQLIKAINETARGILSEETVQFLKALDRPQQGCQKPLYLYAVNNDVDLHNAVELSKVEGVSKKYKSVDSGSEKDLRRFVVPDVS